MIEAQLRGRIVSGDIAPGEQLRHDHIAAHFGTSANPVREAFQRLERAGLVMSRPRRGVVVSPISANDAIEVAHMRSRLEGLALSRAMQQKNRSAAAVAANEALREAGATDDVAAWLAANRTFHMSLYLPSGWQRLLDTIENLWLTSDRHLFAVWSGLKYQQHSQSQHQALLNAYIAGDAGLAEQILSDHIIEAGNALADLLKARLEAPE